MQDIGYSGQYLDNHTFRIKARTGSDIYKATGDCVAGEMLLVTGVNPAFYIATETSSQDSFSIKKVTDLENPITPVTFGNFPGI